MVNKESLDAEERGRTFVRNLYAEIPSIVLTRALLMLMGAVMEPYESDSDSDSDDENNNQKAPAKAKDAAFIADKQGAEDEADELIEKADKIVSKVIRRLRQCLLLPEEAHTSGAAFENQIKSEQAARSLHIYHSGVSKSGYVYGSDEDTFNKPNAAKKSASKAGFRDDKDEKKHNEVVLIERNLRLSPFYNSLLSEAQEQLSELAKQFSDLDDDFISSQLYQISYYCARLNFGFDHTFTTRAYRKAKKSLPKQDPSLASRPSPLRRMSTYRQRKSDLIRKRTSETVSGVEGVEESPTKLEDTGPPSGDQDSVNHEEEADLQNSLRHLLSRPKTSSSDKKTDTEIQQTLEDQKVPSAVFTSLQAVGELNQILEESDENDY